jgi:hypothetical protein
MAVACFYAKTLPSGNDVAVAVAVAEEKTAVEQKKQTS